MKTILNIKTDKSLKTAAQETAEQLGVPLTTVVNAFLKQFVRNKEITLSAHTYQSTPYLTKLVYEAKKELKEDTTYGPFKTAKEVVASLNT